MKYFLLILIVILCSYIGYGLSKYYVKRNSFFKNIIILFEKIKLEINFSQSKLISITTNFSCSNNEIKILIKNFQKLLENNQKIDVDSLFKNIKILSSEEKNILLTYFLTLGKFDVLNQSKQLEGEIYELKNMQNDAEQNEKKYAPLYLKIGIILGLAIALILL